MQYMYRLLTNAGILPWNMVDLDLPSGTLWADRNIGADSEYDYGDYYSWGDTELKESWDSSNTPTYNNDFNTLKARGYVDDNGNLTPTYDIAYIISSGACHMPTSDQFQELYNYTDHTWVTVYNHTGYKFASKTNPEKYIFIPAAGLYNIASLLNLNSNGNIWSSSIDQLDSNYAYSCYINNNRIIPQYINLPLYSGLSVRAVQN